MIWSVSTLISKNSIKSSLFVSLFFVVFFSYGHVYNILSGISIFDMDISRHRFILIPFIAALIFGTLFLLKTKRKLNNLSPILNVVSITIVFIAVFNLGINISQENYFDVNDQSDEKFLGVGASTESFSDMFSAENENIIDASKTNADPTNPDIYYIILDEYGSQPALKNFLDYDNSSFLSEIK